MKATKKNAILARDAVKLKIRRGDKSWPPLQAATIRAKGSSKPLIRHGDLMNSITFRVVSESVAFVGVLRQARSRDGGNMVDIARVHEYGFHGIVIKRAQKRSGIPYMLTIPARPYLGPTLREIAGKLAENWRNHMISAIDRSLGK